MGAESFRSLRTALHFSLLDAKNNIIMITGPSPSIGKSFVSSNLANVFAQADAKVLLIDGDMRKGYMNDVFGLKRENGLSGILSGQKNLEECLHKGICNNLDFLSTGVLPPNASELLLNPRFGDLLKEVSEKYDHVIIDAPPVLAVTDAAVMGSQCGTSLMLARYGQNPMGELELCKKRLDLAGVELKGVLLNDVVKTAGVAGYAYGYSYK